MAKEALSSAAESLPPAMLSKLASESVAVTETFSRQASEQQVRPATSERDGSRQDRLAHFLTDSVSPRAMRRQEEMAERETRRTLGMAIALCGAQVLASLLWARRTT